MEELDSNAGGLIGVDSSLERLPDAMMIEAYANFGYLVAVSVGQLKMKREKSSWNLDEKMICFYLRGIKIYDHKTVELGFGSQNPRLLLC